MDIKAERLYPRKSHLNETDRYADTRECCVIAELKREKVAGGKKGGNWERKKERRKKTCSGVKVIPEPFCLKRFKIFSLWPAILGLPVKIKVLELLLFCSSQCISILSLFKKKQTLFTFPFPAVHYRNCKCLNIIKDIATLCQ